MYIFGFFAKYNNHVVTESNLFKSQSSFSFPKNAYWDFTIFSISEFLLSSNIKSKKLADFHHVDEIPAGFQK